MSRLGLGLAALGRPAYITTGRVQALGEARSVEELRRATWQMLDHAYASGIRYLDAARSYGRAEEFLAGWLAAHPQVRDVVVGSKWGYRYVGGWRLDAPVHEIKDHGVAAFTEQWAATRALLGDRVTIYHVHSATLDSGALDDPELHRALAGLRDAGVRVGLSTSGPAQAEVIDRAMAIEIDGAPLFGSVQATWNLLEPSAGAALSRAADAGARVIVKEVLANGRLTDDPALGTGAEHGADPGADPGVERARARAVAAGLPIDRLAVAAALAQPWAWRVLTGAVTKAQLDSNLLAEQASPDPDVRGGPAHLAEPPEQYWAARAQRPWN